MPRAVVFTGAGQPLEMRPFEELEPCGSEILVRVSCCTLCRSDLHTHAGRRIEPTPTVLGHEIIGRIAAFGPAAPRCDAAGLPLEIGSRVSWSLVVGCGSCFFCQADLPQKCEQLYKYGHERIGPRGPVGGLSDYVILVPGTVCYRVPDAIPDRVAATANCSTATAAAILRRAGRVEGRTVLVLGAGVLGLTVCAMARAGGANEVLVSDPSPERRQHAAQFGATRAVGVGEELAAAVRNATAGRGADVVVELAGVAETAQAALAYVRTGGLVVLAGTVAPVGTIPFDPEQAVRRMLTIGGVHNYHPRDLATALSFLAGAGRDYPWSSLVAAEYSLEQAEEAFAAAHNQPGLRIAICPGRHTHQEALA